MRARAIHGSSHVAEYFLIRVRARAFHGASHVANCFLTRVRARVVIDCVQEPSCAAMQCYISGWIPRFVLKHILERFNLCIQFMKVLDISWSLMAAGVGGGGCKNKLQAKFYLNLQNIFNNSEFKMLG